MLKLARTDVSVHAYKVGHYVVALVKKIVEEGTNATDVRLAIGVAKYNPNDIHFALHDRATGNLIRTPDGKKQIKTIPFDAQLGARIAIGRALKSMQRGEYAEEIDVKDILSSQDTAVQLLDCIDLSHSEQPAPASTSMEQVIEEVKAVEEGRAFPGLSNTPAIQHTSTSA